MFKRINSSQFIVLILDVLILFSMIASILYFHPMSAKITMAFILGFFLYWTLRYYWIIADPENNVVLIKSEAQFSIIKGLCPFCHENHFADDVLRVGYRRPQLDYFAYKILWIEWKDSLNELTESLPICERCKKKYLFLCKFKLFARVGLDRSYYVLERKIGYFRGRRFPFESWNIQKADNA